MELLEVAIAAVRAVGVVAVLAEWAVIDRQVAVALIVQAEAAGIAVLD